MATNSTQDEQDVSKPIGHFDTPDAPVPSAAPVSGGEPAPVAPAAPLRSDPYAVSPHIEGYAPASNPDSPELDDTPGITEIPKDATSEDIEAMSHHGKGPERLRVD